jgi:type IV secretory pathway VirD2 relaxase
MSDLEDGFRVRPGRMRDQGAPQGRRARRFLAEVLQAAVRAGYGGRGPGGRSGLRSTFGRGRGVALATMLRSPSRRVVVKGRIVRQFGRRFRSAPLALHLKYLQREGVERDGEAGRLFDAKGEADGPAFAARCEGDRHHFRFMVSPEDAAQLADLKAFARDLMRQAEKDLATRLDWVAAEHWNTAHPHVHVLVRGKAEDGADLVISRDYMTRGLRARAEALASLELGPRSAREIAADLNRQVDAERWTGLDRLMAGLASEGRVDLRPGPGAPDRDMRPLLVSRAATLERLGLAQGDGPGVWRLADDLEARLRDLALRGDIIKTLHRTMGGARAMSELDPTGETERAPIVGRLEARGLFDEQSGSAYIVVDGLDGRVHHVRLRDLEASGDTPLGGIVEVRPSGPDGPVRLVHRSDLPIDRQVLAGGATWLDRQLVSRAPSPRSDAGFGAEAAAALRVRAEHLESLGLATQCGRDWRFRDGLLGELRRRDLAAAGERLAGSSRLTFEAEGGDEVRGIYRRRMDLASGRFAMVEDGLGFRLVPWARVLDSRLGEEVRGRLREGGIDWDLGRDRGLSR